MSRCPSSVIAAAVLGRRLRPTTYKRWATPMSLRWVVGSGRGKMRGSRRRNASLSLVLVLIATCARAQDSTPAPKLPQVPFGLDAFTQWERWPYLRIGVRCYMRSTFDRTGGNNNADAAHFIRQIDDTHNVAMDELGPGILWFVRYNHWHGSPWQYLVDGKEIIVQETSTRDPLHPAKDSVFMPATLFPSGLNFTWSATKGADLSWTPISFEKSLRI